MRMIQGPNVKRLIARRMATLMVPRDANGNGFAMALGVLTDTERLKGVAQQATDDIEQAINLVILAKDNPWGDDEELIAGEILKRLEQKSA